MTRFGFWLISITFFFSACSRKETPLPEGILDRKALVPVLVDVHLAQASVAILRTADTTAHAMGDYMDFIPVRESVLENCRIFLDSIR